MPRNQYFSHGTESEQNLYEGLIIESLRIFGHEVYYLPRKVLNTAAVWNEATLSEFAEAFACEMYVESVDGFEGDGNLLSTFGLQVKNQIKLSVSRLRWKQLVGRHQTYGANIRPKEGDLLWIPFCKGMFEIQFVDGDTPFYQLQNMPTYSITCELFEYSNERFETSIPDIDKYEREYANRHFVKMVQDLNDVDFKVGEKAYQIVPSAQALATLTLDTDPLHLGTQILNASVPDTQVHGEIAEITSEGVYLVGVYADDGLSVFRTSSLESSALIGAQTNAQFNIEVDEDAEGNDIGVIHDLEVLDETNRHSDNAGFEVKGNEFISFDEDNPFGTPDEL